MKEVIVDPLIDQQDLPEAYAEAWSRLRGALKDVFAELEGGEAYLRAERSSFCKPGKCEWSA